MATKDELLTDVLRLSQEQRAEVALELLLSLEEAEEDAEAAWEPEVAERAQEVLDGTVKTVPWPEIQARLSARLQRGH